MAHLNKKKLSLSERFGTIGPVDYQSKACKNSEMVSKLQMQITEVVRKRTDGNVGESQAKMISEEISDIQQRFDDAPVACQKFTPFKVELKVNKGNKPAENQKDTERKVHNYNAGNIEGSNNTDNNENSQDNVNKIEVCHDSGLNHNPIKEYGSKNNGTSVTVTGVIAEEPKFKNNVQGSMGKCRNDERDLNIQPSPKFYQDTSSFNTHQHYDVERNSNKKWLKKNAEHNSPLNTAKNLQTFQEQPKKDQNESPGNQQTYQSWKQKNSTGNYSGRNNKKQEAEFKKTNSDRTIINFRDSNGAQTSQNLNRTQSLKSSPNFNKGKGPKFKMGKSSKASPKFNKGQGSEASPNFNKGPGFKTSPKFNTNQGPKTSPIFNKGPGFQTSPHFNYGQGCNYKASPNFNNGQHCNASPNLNTGPGCKASPNLNKGQGFQADTNLNKGQGFQADPNLNKGQGFQADPNLNKGPGFQASPNLNKGQGFQTSSNPNKGQGFQTSSNLNKGQGFQTSPNLNKGQGFQTSPNLNKGQGFQTSPNPNKGQGFQTSPNLNKGQGFQTSPNLNKGQGFQTSPNLNKGQGFQTSPNPNKGQGFQTSSNLNKGQGFQTSPNLNKGQGFQTSSNLNKGQGFQTSPNLNKGQGFQTSSKLNKGQGFQANPNLNKGQGFQTSSNLNKGQGFQTSPNLNKGQGFQTSSNLNKGQGFQTSPNLNKGQGFQTSSKLNKGQGFQANPNLNKGQGFQTSQNLNKGQGFQTSPNLNKGQGFQTKLDFNKKQGIQTSQSFNKRPGFQTSPNFSKSPDFQASPNLNHINDIHTSANNRQCSEVSQNQNNGQNFQTSSDFNKGKDFQASPNFNKGPGFQASTGFKQNNVPKSFGCNKSGPRNTQDSQTNVQQHFAADTFASDDPCTIYDIQDQFYNYHSKKMFPKGRQQRANFYNNKPGFGGHRENQQRSFSSNPPHQYHGNQARKCHLQASANNVVQPPEYTSSEQSYTAGGFGKRHASPVGSNKYMSPAKKRMLATDPLNKDIPSYQNRLQSSNPPWQGNHCKVSSDNNYVDNQSLPYGYYPGHVPNTPFHPPVAGNYGLALHGPFTPKTWNAPTQHYTSNLESADARATLGNKFHPLNETDGLSSTKHYLFNKMLDQNDTRRSTGDVLKPAKDNVKPIRDVKKPIGDVKPTGDIVQPSGGIVKPTGFYQEIANESSGMTATIHKEKEETELVSTLLTQCQAMAQKDDDRQALHTIFNIIQQEMGHQPFQASSVRSKIPSIDYKPEQTRSFSDASMNGDDAKFSPTSSSPDAASKQNGNIRFEGRTLLKGGVKPRHIPKTLINKQDDDPPRDPRPVKDSKTQPLTARKMKDLPLPPFFIEFVATEKFGKKDSDDGKLNQVMHQDAEKNMNEVHNECVPSAEFKTTDVKTGIGKVDDYNESNLGIKQQEETKENIVAETKQEKCGPETLETRKSDVVSHILPRITVRQEQGVSASDKTSLKKDHYVDVNSRDPRLRATSISKKRDDNPKVDLLVLKYEECTVGQQHKACDDVNGKALECVLEPEQTQSGGSKECNEAYLVTKLSRDGLQSRQRNSPIHHKDTSGRETNISRSSLEKSSRHCSVPKDIAKEFSSRKLPIHQRRYSGSGNGSTKEIDQFHSSPSRRYSRFSSERSLSRSRSSSRSRDEEWTEKEVAIRRTNNVNFSHRNMCLSQSYERNTVVYSRDRHSEHNRNRFQERDEHDRMNKERISMSPGTCRYLKRRDLERSTPPSSTNRNVYKSQYQGRRNRNYSEGSDYPESCSSPLR